MKVMNLIYDDTKNSSDLLYRTRFKAPDPIIFFEIRKKKYLVLNDLEIERGKKQARVDEILSLREISEEIKSNGDLLRPIELKLNPNQSENQPYLLVRGRMRFWGWIIAFGYEKEIECKIF